MCGTRSSCQTSDFFRGLLTRAERLCLVTPGAEESEIRELRHGVSSWIEMHNAVECAVAQGAVHRYIRRMMGLIVPPFSLSLAA